MVVKIIPRFSYFHTFRTMGYLKNTRRTKSLITKLLGKEGRFHGHLTHYDPAYRQGP